MPIRKQRDWPAERGARAAWANLCQALWNATACAWSRGAAERACLLFAIGTRIAQATSMKKTVGAWAAALLIGCGGSGDGGHGGTAGQAGSAGHSGSAGQAGSGGF